VIDHASTPNALKQVLCELRSHLHGRLFCILHSRRGHRRALADVASSLADEVHEVSGSTRSAVLRGVLRRAGRHDIVLIAGGGKGDWARQGEAEVRHLLEEAA
jgi:UDP-N-acetylmuramyl tripeptide synthase